MSQLEWSNVIAVSDFCTLISVIYEEEKCSLISIFNHILNYVCTLKSLNNHDVQGVIVHHQSFLALSFYTVGIAYIEYCLVLALLRISISIAHKGAFKNYVDKTR